MTEMNVDEYINEAEFAVRHLYDGLAECWRYYEDALEHWDISRIGFPLTLEEKERINIYLQRSVDYFALKFSEATIAGSILQVAATAIRLYSPIEEVPNPYLHLVNPKAKGAIPFCVGKQIHGLPTGLIVYAGRNQYTHWEEDPYEVTQNIFEELTQAFSQNVFYDLAFALDNPTIIVYANEILLGALGWQDYETYFLEMKNLLGF